MGNLTRETAFKCEHVSMPVKVAGVLPRDRDAIVAGLGRAIEQAADGSLERYRVSIRSI